MVPAKIETAFNEQIKHEIESGYLYLAMAAWLEDAGLPGMGRWMRAQTQEELTHAMRFYKHIAERGGRVRLHALAEPKAEWESALAAFEAAYKHEQFITGRINDLMKLSRAENDFASQGILQWFVDEQVEEEDTTKGIVDKLKLVGRDGNGLLMIDRELAARNFVLAPELADLYAQAQA
ncbi:MAG: ferritin [bacterium]